MVYPPLIFLPMKTTGPTYKRLLLVALVAFLKKPSYVYIVDIWTQTVSSTKDIISFKRAVLALKDTLDVKIVVNRSQANPVKGGTLHIQNWGVIDPINLYLTLYDELVAIGIPTTELKDIETVKGMIEQLRD